MTENNSFDLIAIGGGAAGLVSSSFAAGLGLKVALVSDGHPGGECLWTGCVPSKALIHRASVSRVLKNEGASNQDHAFKLAMQYMKEKRQKISHHDSVETIEKNGVSVITGRARFIDEHTLEVGDQKYISRKFVIATGGYQKALPVEGISKAGYLTHESILELEEKPAKLLIVGGGPVGVEYAQLMTRLGSEVVIAEAGPVLLRREEPEASLFVRNLLESEGCVVHTDSTLSKVEVAGSMKVCTFAGKNGKNCEVDCSHIFIATGKTPNVESLNLEAAGVSLLPNGFVKTDAHMRTSAKHIWACGDIAGTYQFTHYADHTARIAIINACLKVPARREERVVPWCTFLEPEVAHVGLTEQQATSEFGAKVVFSLKYGLEDYDRAILDDVDSGFMKVVINKKGTIFGATVVGARAGEMIHEFALAMRKKVPIQDLSGLIHVYPTMSGAVRNLSNQYYQQVMTESWQSRLVKLWAQLVR